MYQDISGFNIGTDVKTRVSQAHAHIWKHAETHNWTYVYTHRDIRKPKYFPTTERKRFLVRREVSPRKIKIKIKLGWACPEKKEQNPGTNGEEISFQNLRLEDRWF